MTPPFNETVPTPLLTPGDNHLGYSYLVTSLLIQAQDNDFFGI